MGRQQVAGLIFLSIGIYGLVFSVPLPWGTWEEPGPGLFPLAVAILLCLAGIVKIFQDKGKEEGGRTDWRELARGFLTPMKILGITLVFILALERLGYLLATPLFMFILLQWVCRYRILVALILALVIGVGSWYFFDKLLAVQLPQGILRFF
jgi:putative tricarboxylic transport membrane protein